jgi:hypothetical protein
MTKPALVGGGYSPQSVPGVSGGAGKTIFAQYRTPAHTPEG